MNPEADAALQDTLGMKSTPRSGSLAVTSSSALHALTPEFLMALRSYRLAAILQDGPQDMCMTLHEYDAYHVNSACPIEDPVAFLLKPASELFLDPHILLLVRESNRKRNHPVKWLHMHDGSKRVIVMLAVKYQWDPRFVLRVLSLGSAKADQMSFCDMQYEVTLNAAAAASPSSNCGSTSASSSFQYARVSPELLGAPSIERPMWLFMTVPILRLSEHSRSSFRKYEDWREQMFHQLLFRRDIPDDPNRIVDEMLDASTCIEIVVEHCNLAMFVSGIAEGNMAVTFSSDWAELMRFSNNPKIADRTGPMNNRCCRSRTNNKLAGSSSAGCTINQTAIGSNNSGTASDRVPDTARLSMFPKVLAELNTDYLTRFRHGDSHTFMLKVLCDFTEDYLLIGQAYEACLLILQKRMKSKKDNLCSEEVSRIIESIEQLSQLYKVVEPVATMLDTISSRNLWGYGNAEHYLPDIKSNASKFLKIVSTSKEHASALVEKYKQYRETKTNPFWPTFASINFVFFVGQFLKLLFGIEFHSFVLTSTPTLTLEHLYLYSWCLLICIPSIRYIMYRLDES